MTNDLSTLSFYAENPEEYARKAPKGDFLEKRSAFMSRVVPGSKILELGCGGGHDALAFIQAGFDVTLLDGSHELAALAQVRAGREVLVRDFSEIDFSNEFDAVWASASLLHVPSIKLPLVLGLIFKSLRQDGVFTASFKEGKEDWVDEFGRRFCGMDSDKLKTLLQIAGFQVEPVEIVEGFGSDLKPTRWIWVHAIRNN